MLHKSFNYIQIFSFPSDFRVHVFEAHLFLISFFLASRKGRPADTFDDKRKDSIATFCHIPIFYYSMERITAHQSYKQLCFLIYCLRLRCPKD